MPFNYDLVCLSHLRWDFVYQRPQHLLSRFARDQRVFYVEEPLALSHGEYAPRLDVAESTPNVRVVVPRLPTGISDFEGRTIQQALLKTLFTSEHIDEFVLWYYTPMPLAFSRELPTPLATVYDCMDELSAFRGAPPELVLREAELMQRTDVVFTGGQTLFEAKRGLHPNVHAFPSSVDVAHFAKARCPQQEPADQAALGGPRLGFCGVLDERLDTQLLADLASIRPDWQFIMVGPVAKIDPACLPRPRNIHYLGAKTYPELPAYLSGWDVALIPFARNESTRFISPTKTPEYLAAGRPVVSTPIRDVVRPYGVQRLARIAETAEEFVAAAEAALSEDAAERQVRVDRFLASMSWDHTWSAMDTLVREAIDRRSARSSRQAVRAA